MQAEKTFLHSCFPIFNSSTLARKFIYLINPISGTSPKSKLSELIAEKTEEAGLPFEILHTRPNGNYSELKDKIQREGITDVIVCGGDGTISAVVAELSGLDIRFGIVPSGSGNGLAFAAGIPAAPVKALEIIFNGKAGYADGIELNGKFSCMLCGIGFDAQVAHDFAEANTRGLHTYIKLSAINYLKAKPYPFIISYEQTTIHTEAFFLSIANGNQFGNHFTIAPMASLNDGLMDVVIVKKMNKLMLPFSLLNQVTGINPLQNPEEHFDRKNIIYFQTAELKITNPSLAPLHIDGDPAATSGEFLVKIKPQAFKLLQP